MMMIDGINNIQTNNQRTKYPKLYHDTYWGNYHKCQHTGNAHIIENRNLLAMEYILKSRIRNLPLKYEEKVGLFEDLNELKNFKKKYDGDKSMFIRTRDRRDKHIEYYKTVDKKIIAVFSPYDTSDRMTQMALECGYSLIYPLYADDANTFVKVIQQNFTKSCLKK